MKTLKTKDRYSYLLLVGIPFIILCIITLAPLIYSIYASFLSWNLAIPEAKKFIGLRNYFSMFKDSNFWNSSLNTLYQVSVTVIVQLIFGMVMALLLSRNFKGIRVIRSLYMLPMMMTPIVVGLLWRMLLNPEFGMINYFLSLISIKGPDWLGSSKLAMPSIIFTDIWVSTPFVAMIILAGIQSLPREPFEAAKIDGATLFQSFRYIMLPLLKPVIWVAILFRFMDAVKRFDTIYVMTSGGPGNVTETMNIYAWSNAFTFLNTGYSAALATVMLLIIFVVSILLIRNMQRSGVNY